GALHGPADARVPVAGSEPGPVPRRVADPARDPIRAPPATGAGLEARYHTAQRFSGGLTIAAPAGQEKVRWNSARFETVPITRNFGTGCGSVSSIWRCASGRRASPRSWAKATKNR